MKIDNDTNQLNACKQDAPRVLKLRLWKVAHDVSWVDMGRVMGIGACAALASLTRQRMPVAHHKALLAAYPHLPESFLPVPEDVPRGRKPRKTESSTV